MSPHDVEFDIEFFVDDNGNRPVELFLKEEARSNPKLATRTKAALLKLRDGRYHRPPNTESLGDEMYELRILGNNSARVLFFFGGQRRIVLVHAFKKKGQRTPPRDLETAHERKRRYEERASVREKQ